MIFRAIKFVAEAHSGQYRKGTNIPYKLDNIEAIRQDAISKGRKGVGTVQCPKS